MCRGFRGLLYSIGNSPPAPKTGKKKWVQRKRISALWGRFEVVRDVEAFPATLPTKPSLCRGIDLFGLAGNILGLTLHLKSAASAEELLGASAEEFLRRMPGRLTQAGMHFTDTRTPNAQDVLQSVSKCAHA